MSKVAERSRSLTTVILRFGSEEVISDFGEGSFSGTEKVEAILQGVNRGVGGEKDGTVGVGSKPQELGGKGWKRNG